MSDPQYPNQDQAKNWNEVSGRIWVEMQPVLDKMFAPLEPILIDAVLSGNPDGDSVLDIGCGAGATTMAAARRLGQNGKCLGVDISAPLVKRANERAAESGISTARFQVGDAQTHEFDPQSFDAAISRFGVMFFEDPIAAFINIRSALRENGRLAFLAWRSPRENPFMTAAARAARPHLPDLPRFEPNAPGQFGFADDDYVRGILDSSGWRSMRIEPIDVGCEFPAKDLDSYIMNMGPVGAALRKLDPDMRNEIAAEVREAFTQFVVGDRAKFEIACWLVRAVA
jgi:SAM-dependent methyltransferase